MGKIVISALVYTSVCPRAYLRNHIFNLHRTCYLWQLLGLFQWRCDTLCSNSGSVDDAMFVHTRSGHEHGRKFEKHGRQAYAN